ncbi:MAG: hypothetical protein QW757_03045 [Candidatus Woesearchaeota archaeon]
MLEPIESNELEEKIKQSFNDGEYWQVRILINDLYQKTGISTNYFTNLILSYEKKAYYTERDICTNKMCINIEKLEKLIISSMKENENPEIKAKGYLLSIGWTGLDRMTAIEVCGELYCYPKSLEPFNPNISEIPSEAIILFKDGRKIQVMANYGAKVIEKRTKNIFYNKKKSNFPLVN